MKKILGIAVVFAVFIACASRAHAENFFTREEMEDPWNTKVMVSWVHPSESHIDDGINIQGRITYDWNEYLAFGMELGYTRYGDDHYNGVTLGQFWSIPILADIIVQYPIDTGDYILVPYMVNGFGFSINQFDEDDEMDRVNWGMDIDTCFIYKLGFGLDFFINEWFALNFETSYQWMTITAKLTGPGVDECDNGELNAFYLGGGASIQF